MPQEHAFRLVAGEHGTDLVVTGDWSSQARKEILDGNADGLVLNYAKGFRERDLRFIEGLPLRRLDILARTHSDLTPIYTLSSTLEELSLQTAPTPVDLSRLPSVVRVGATWSQVEATIHSLPGLQDLFVLAYDEPDLSALFGNKELVSLSMKDRPRVQTLDGVEDFTWLRHLALPLAPVHSLEPLTSASPLLKVLDFSHCRNIGSIAPIGPLEGLLRVDFSDCGDIESVGVFDSLKLVEDILMWGSTRVVDGDLSPLARLSRLRTLRMKPRKTYRPPVSEIKIAIGDI